MACWFVVFMIHPHLVQIRRTIVSNLLIHHCVLLCFMYLFNCLELHFDCKMDLKRYQTSLVSCV